MSIDVGLGFFLNEQLIIKIHILYYKLVFLSMSPTLHIYLISICYHLYMGSKHCYVFIDSSNLFYGGKGRLTWRIDYEKLSNYLKRKYLAKKIFYYSGINTYGYNPKLLSVEPYPIQKHIKFVEKKIKKSEQKEKRYIEKDLARAKFLRRIEGFGYILRLKPIKYIKSFDGTIKMKANCDVDLTLDAMRLIGEYQKILVLSGDGDFEILLRYLKEQGRDIEIIANSKNTAWIYKQEYSKNLRNFEEIRESVLEKNERYTH